MRRRSGRDGERRPRRCGVQRWTEPATLVLGTLVVAVLGCAATRSHRPAGLPSGHAARSHQVLLMSDQRLPQEAEILRELGQVRDRVAATLGIPHGEREVVVYLFADRERYARYMQETHPNLPARRAFFIGTPRELAVYAHWGEQVITDLRHEYTHGLLHAAVGHVPLWLDEGLAEYFEIGSGRTGDLNPEHVARLAGAAATGWQPDLRRLERLEEVHEMSREDYHEAWAWIHFLLHEVPAGRELISQYLRELRRGETAVPLSARLGPELRAAESQLATYVLGLDPDQRVQPAGLQLPQRPY